MRLCYHLLMNFRRLVVALVTQTCQRCDTSFRYCSGDFMTLHMINCLVEESISVAHHFFACQLQVHSILPFTNASLVGIGTAKISKDWDFIPVSLSGFCVVDSKIMCLTDLMGKENRGRLSALEAIEQVSVFSFFISSLLSSSLDPVSVPPCCKASL